MDIIDDYIIVVCTIPREIVSEDTVTDDTVEYQIKYSTYEELNNIINGLPMAALISLTELHPNLNSSSKVDDIIEAVFPRSGNSMETENFDRTPSLCGDNTFNIVVSEDIVL